MGNDDTTTEDLGHRRSGDSLVLEGFGRALQGFAVDIITCAGAIDRLDPTTRLRVLDEISSRCGTFGDLAHDARRAIKKLK